MPKVSIAPAAPAVAAEFEPPPVEMGQVVLWSYGRGSPPSPAVVLKVATRTITVAVHVDGVKDHILRNGVRHALDPFLKATPQHDQGTWDLTPRDRKINALLEAGRFVGEE